MDAYTAFFHLAVVAFVAFVALPVTWVVSVLMLLIAVDAGFRRRLQDRVKRFLRWLVERPERTLLALAILVVAAVLILDLLGLRLSTPMDEFIENRRYVLSTIAQILGTILALLVTMTVVVAQLAASIYTPQVFERRLRDWWFWAAVVIYGLAMLLTLVVLNNPFLLFSHEGELIHYCGDDIAYFLAAFVIIYLIPYAAHMVGGLRIERFAAEADFFWLDDMARKAINEGLDNSVEVVVGAIVEWAKKTNEHARTWSSLNDIFEYARDHQQWQCIVPVLDSVTKCVTIFLDPQEQKAWTELQARVSEALRKHYVRREEFEI